MTRIGYARLGFSSYQDYLGSEHWKTVRRKWWTLNPDASCYACRSEERPLELHHRTYERLGKERWWDSNELIPLCRRCHQQTRKDGLQAVIAGRAKPDEPVEMRIVKIPRGLKSMKGPAAKPPRTKPSKARTPNKTCQRCAHAFHTKKPTAYCPACYRERKKERAAWAAQQNPNP